MTDTALTEELGTDHPVAARGAPLVARRVGIIWGLLVLNGLGSQPGILLPRAAMQAITMGCLFVALMLALTLNRRLLIRPNLVLTMCTILGATAFMTSVRGISGAGAVFRSVRLFVFLAVLWLLSPFWERRDMLIAKCHVRALMVVCGSVVVSVLLFPSAALRGNATGRLSGVLWPIPPTQVGEYAAVLAGMATVLWLSGSLLRRTALLIEAITIPMVLLSRTRTALVAALAGVIIASLTLFLKRQQVRRMARSVALLVPLVAIALAPALSSWFLRNQSAEQIGTLTGREKVWARALAAPRTEFDQWFGLGLSDKSFGGLPIDSTWVAVYQDQGLIGAGLVAVILVYLLVATVFRRAGPERALATFLVVYCIFASYTEVGVGDVSPYLLHVVVAASLIASGGGSRATVAREPPASTRRLYRPA